MSEITFSDNYGDEVSVRTALKDGTPFDEPGIAVTITDAWEQDPQIAEARFNRKGAIDFALGILASVEADVSFTPANLFAGESGDERVEWNDAALKAAVEHNRTATLSYQKESGPGGLIERRQFQPDQRILNRSGDVIYVGHDLDRNDVRAFRLDRVTGYVQVN